MVLIISFSIIVYFWVIHNNFRHIFYRGDILRLELRKKPVQKANYSKKIIAIILLLCSIVIATFSFFNMGSSTMLREVAQSELESIAFDIVGATAQRELEKGDYGNIVEVVYDTNGAVSSVSADMQKLNLLKLRIANELSEEMFKRTEDTIKIPLGNLTGIDFLTGIGPDVKFRILWVSSVNSDFSNSFESAGVNQTCYRIMLDFSINVGMMLAGREIGVDVGTDICVAETIIVGSVPEFFAGKQ